MLCSSGMGTGPDCLIRSVKILHNVTYSSPSLVVYLCCVFIYFASLMLGTFRTPINAGEKNLGRNKKK